MAIDFNEDFLANIVNVNFPSGWYVFLAFTATANGNNIHNIDIDGGKLLLGVQGTSGAPGDRNYQGHFLLKLKNKSAITVNLSGAIEVETAAGYTASITGFSYYQGTVASASFPLLPSNKRYIVAEGDVAGTPISNVTHAIATFTTTFPDVFTTVVTTNIVGDGVFPAGEVVVTTNVHTGTSQTTTYVFPFPYTVASSSVPVGWDVGMEAYVWPTKGYSLDPTNPFVPLRKNDSADSPFESYQWHINPNVATHTESGIQIGGNSLLDGRYQFAFEKRRYLTADAKAVLPMIYPTTLRYDADGWNGSTLIYSAPTITGVPPLH